MVLALMGILLTMTTPLSREAWAVLREGRERRGEWEGDRAFWGGERVLVGWVGGERVFIRA